MSLQRLLTISLVLLLSNSTFSQQFDQKVLFKINKEEIKVEEFILNYNKSEKENVKKSSREDYFELYFNFRLKLHEAKSLRFDTINRLSKEWQAYKIQLAKSYVKKGQAINEQTLIELSENNKTFRDIITDLRNGIFIFELMTKMVWEPSADEQLLHLYHERNRTKYTWPKRISASIITVKKESILNDIRQFVKDNNINGALQKYNSGDEPNMIVKNGLFNCEEISFNSNQEIKLGMSEAIQTNEGLKFIMVHHIFEPESKKLDEIRGVIMADYQQELEEEWLQKLKLKHKISIKKNRLNKLLK